MSKIGQIFLIFFSLKIIKIGEQLLLLTHFDTTGRHSSIYAFNVGTHKKRGKGKPHKSRLLSSTKGEENRIEL